MSIDLKKYLIAQKEYYPSIYGKVMDKKYESGWVDFVFPRLLIECDSARSREYGLSDMKTAQAFWKNKLLRTNYIEMIKIIQESMTTKEYKEVFSDRARKKIDDSLSLFIGISKENEKYENETDILIKFNSNYCNNVSPTS